MIPLHENSSDTIWGMKDLVGYRDHMTYYYMPSIHMASMEGVLQFGYAVQTDI